MIDINHTTSHIKPHIQPEYIPVAKKKDSFQKEDVAQRLTLLVDVMRNQAEWTQADFARKVGITPSRLSHYLNGRYVPQIDVLARISQNLGVSAEWFLFGTGPMWRRDMAQGGGIGVGECTLAMAAVLSDIAEQLRTSVAQKPDRAKGKALDVGDLVSKVLESRAMPKAARA